MIINNSIANHIIVVMLLPEDEVIVNEGTDT